MQQSNVFSSLITSIRRILTPPLFPTDEDKTRLARGFHAVLIANTVIGLGYAFFSILTAQRKLGGYITLATVIAIMIPLLILLHRGKLRVASILLVSYFWILVSVILFVSGGMASSGTSLYIPVVTIALLFLGRRVSLSILVLTLVYTFVLFVSGLVTLPDAFPITSIGAWVILTVGLVTIFAPIDRMQHELMMALSRVREQLAERLTIEGTLQESEERFRLISSVTSDYTFSSKFDGQGNLEHHVYGGAFESITGYTPDEFVKLGGWQAIVHPNDRAQDARDMAMLGENKSVITEVRIIRKDGQIRWVRVYGYPLKDNTNQKLVGIYGAVQDITERKLTEQALQESEERFRLISAITTDYTFASRFNAEGKLVTQVLTGAFTAMTGYTPDEFLTMGGWRAILHPDDQAQNERDFEALKNNQTIETEARIIRKDGNFRWVRVYAYPVWDTTTNQMVGVDGAVQDINKRKLAEIALQESEERFRLISSITSDYTYSSRFNAEGKLETKVMTGAFSTITGYTPDEFVKLGGWQAILHPDYQAQNDHDMGLLEKNQSIMNESQIIKKGGELRWVRMYGYPVWDTANNKLLGVDGAVQDITERKVAEIALQESEKRYRVISDIISDYAYAYDIHVDGTFSTAWITEDAFKRLTGFAWQEIGANYGLYHPDSLLMAQQHVKQTMEGQATSGEYKIITKAGETRWIHIQRQLEWDETEKRYVRFYGAAQDITERKQAESALAKDRKLLRTVIDNLQDNIFVIDKDGKFLLNNAESLRILGVTSQEELLGKTDFDFFPHEEAQEWFDAYQQTMRRGQPVIDLELFHPELSDKRRWTLHSSVPLHDEQGEVTGLLGINRDITERKEAESALAKDRKLLRMVIDSLPDNIFVKDKDGKFLLNNAKSMHILGVSSQEELLGKTDFDFFSREQAEEWFEEHKQIMALGQPVTDAELFQPWYPDSRRWILESTYPLIDDRGEVTGLLGINRDISERKVNEEALREKEAFLRALLDATSDIAFLMSVEGVFLTVNKPLSESLGFSKDELLGENAFDLLKGEVRDERYRQLKICLETRQPVRWQDRGVNGWWDNSFYPVLSESGEVEAVAGYAKNINEEKRLAAELQRYTTQLEQMVEERTVELRRAKEQIEIILNNTRDAIALAQANGDIETRNPAFIAMFGDQVSNWIELLMVTVANDEQSAAVSKALFNTIQNKQGQRVELQIISETSGNKDIDLAFIPVQLTNTQERSGVLVSAHDITHIKQIERFKTRFIDNAMHDLATPITGLTNRLYLMKRSPEKLDEHLHKLENQVGHLRNLLDDLRSLSQLDRGQLALKLDLYDINLIVGRVYDTYEPVAISKGQVLKLETNSDLPAIAVDARQMERVFVNLLANAVNYTPNDKSILVQTLLDEDAVIFSVRDEGMGISPEDLPHIFERFYRSTSARKSQSTGTGLGLAIVKEIVEQHGGSVTAESELGKGSTFIVRLPIRG